MFVQDKHKEPLVSDKDAVAKQIKNRDRKPECRERGYYAKDDNDPPRQVWGLLRFDSIPQQQKKIPCMISKTCIWMVPESCWCFWIWAYGEKKQSLTVKDYSMRCEQTGIEKDIYDHRYFVLMLEQDRWTVSVSPDVLRERRDWLQLRGFFIWKSVPVCFFT